VGDFAFLIYASSIFWSARTGFGKPKMVCLDHFLPCMDRCFRDHFPTLIIKAITPFLIAMHNQQTCAQNLNISHTAPVLQEKKHHCAPCACLCLLAIIHHT
jgi:hypothetical protein